MVSQALKYVSYSLGPLIIYLGHIFLIHHRIVKLSDNFAFHFYLVRSAQSQM